MAPSTKSKIQAAKAMKAKVKAKTMTKKSSRNMKPKKMAVKKSQLKRTSINKMMQKTAKSKKSPNKETPQKKKVLQPKQKMVAKKPNPGPSKPKSEANAPTESKFNLDMFITEKLGPMNMENKKKIISDSSSSTLADLIKFNTNLAHSFYNITDLDSLEVTLLALQPKVDEDSQDLSHNVRVAYKEVAMYKDLLLLGDLPTITQEKRPLEWITAATSLRMPAQVAIMTSCLTLAIKMTGKKPVAWTLKMPGGKLLGKKKDEVTSYMAIMQTIVDAMSKGNKWNELDKFAILRKMEKDFIQVGA